MPLTAIALIGAAGNLGPSVLSALLAATNPTLAVTVITRQSSQSTYPPTVTVKSIPANPTHADLVAVLTGQHALITTFSGSNSTLQLALASACATAGVQRFIPADFGSCDSSSDLALSLLPLYREKAKVRTHLQSLAAHTSTLTWTSLVTGHFFDFSLRVEPALLLLNPTERKATIIDGGTTMFSTSTLHQVGEAVVSILRNETLTRNRMLYVQSFCITQKQLLAVCEKVLQGGRKWEVEDVRSEDFIKLNKTKMDDSNGNDQEARENLVGVVGIIDGDWRQREGFANEMLGLKEEDLEVEVRKVLERQK